MPHSDDKPDGWGRPEDSSAVPTGRAERPRADDPLAELARLVDEDPFADFRRDAPAAGRDEPMPPPSPQPYGPPEPTVPEDSADQRVDRESLYAEITAAQEREAEAGEAGPAAPEEDAAQWAAAEWAEPEAAEIHRAEPAASSPEWEVPEQSSDFDPVAALAAELQAMPPEPHPDEAIEAIEAPGFRTRQEAEPWLDEWSGATAQDEPVGTESWARDGETAYWPDQQSAPAYAGHEPAPHFSEPELPFAEASQDDGYVPTYVADHRQHSADHQPFNDADPYGDGVYGNEERGGRRRGVMVVSGLVALVVLGSAAALAYRGFSGEVGGSGGEPPVIRADSAPAKLAADEPQDTAEGQGKLVYDRIGGASGDGDSRIVSREEPVFDVGGRDQAPLRVVSESDEGVRTIDRGRRADPDQPRRVRTVVVRPDGTVVSSPEQVATALPPDRDIQTAEAAGAEVGDAARSQVPSAEGETETVGAAAAIGEDEGESFEPPSAGQTGAQIQPPEPQAQAATQPPNGTRTQSGQPLQLMPQGGETAGAGPTQPEQVAQAPTTAPQAPSQAAAQPAAFPSGSYIVQVGSTRSEDDARGSASAVARRHGDLISGYQTAIERADLGDRGVFYRVGVGPVSSQSDADTLCSRLRSAGTDCFVRRN